MTPDSAIPVSLLYNEKLLRYMLQQRLDGGMCTGPEGDVEPYTAPWYEDFARREFQLTFQRQENELFTSRWRAVCARCDWSDVSSPVLAALQSLHQEYMEVRDRAIHVKLERFSEWQNLVANICLQPVMAYAESDLHRYHWNRLKETTISSELLCYPYEIAVEDYIARHGLNDAHVHINACTYVECGWIHALRNPWESYQHLLKHTDKHAARQQFLEVFEDKPLHALQQHLLIARNLRYILRAHVMYPPDYDQGVYKGGGLVFMQACSPETRIGMLADVEFHPVPPEKDPDMGDYGVQIRQERYWMARLIHELSDAEHRDGKMWLFPLFHTYLLLMNEYASLFFQRETQRGFSQFSNTQQMSTPLKFRPGYYYECFKHFHGPDESSIVHYLDARIAPGMNSGDNYAQLGPFLQEYYHYLYWAWERSHPLWLERPQINLGTESLQELICAIAYLEHGFNERHVRLCITAHFIKKPWQWTDTDSYRYNSYRTELAKRCEALRDTFAGCPQLESLFKAVDAANDEQYVPTSVFAPAFRYCRDVLQMDNITFHCGEDFPHLLSGLRVLDDAIHCLHLDCGDRIGHATALGIDPTYWRRSVPKQLFVQKENRMLDLLFALRVLRNNPALEPAVQEAAYKELMCLAHEMFDVCRHVKIDLVTLGQAMELRWLSPQLLIGMFGTEEEYVLQRIHEFKKAPKDYIEKYKYNFEEPKVFWKREIELTVGKLTHASPQAILLLIMWFTRKDIWENGQGMTEVTVEREHDKLYLLMQQHLMQGMHDKRIVVETLPTSNLRISYYRHAWEHHAMRWLLKKPDTFKDDPKLFLAFGSDDPGVFSCDTKSEFYLLYSCLREYGITGQEALKLLDEVNNRGRVYSFANTNFRRRMYEPVDD